MSTEQNTDTEIQTSSTDSDVSRINEFFNSTEIKNDLHWFTYRDTLDRAFDRDDRRLFYVEHHEDIVGGLMVWCESRVLESDEAQIRLVAVHPEWRGQGIGSRLCSRAEEFADDYGKEVVIADVDKSSTSVEFWKRVGYEVRKEWETDGKREMYQVSKSI